MKLSTEYMGIKLKSPIVVAASPLAVPLGNPERMEAAGAAAIVLHSLFEEQLLMEQRSDSSECRWGSETLAGSLGNLPEADEYRMSHERYMEYLLRVKQSVGIPVIGSLNGVTAGWWVRFAREMEQAGADAIELNSFALATDPRVTAKDTEDELVELAVALINAVKIPVAVKLSADYTSLPNLVSRLDRVGVRGLVLFNRFYLPQFDIDSLEVRPQLHFSVPAELTQRLHWVAILFGQVNAEMAVTGGVYSARDVLECIMAGASVAMMASALYVHGLEHIAHVLDGVRDWMGEHGYESLDQMRGSMSRRYAPDSSPYDRGNYIRTLRSYPTRDAQKPING